jgi:hypothetical protein
MRVGSNPYKDQLLRTPEYVHQVVIPVCIPHEKVICDSFKILKLCLNSLLATKHSKTFISVINNGSCTNVNYIWMTLYQQAVIQGDSYRKYWKTECHFKGIVGNKIPLVNR